MSFYVCESKYSCYALDDEQKIIIKGKCMKKEKVKWTIEVELRFLGILILVLGLACMVGLDPSLIGLGNEDVRIWAYYVPVFLTSLSICTLLFALARIIENQQKLIDRLNQPLLIESNMKGNDVLTRF